MITSTQKQLFGSATNPFTQSFLAPMTFTKFDTRLGTLTGVSIVLHESGNVASTATNSQSVSESYSNVSATGLFSIKGPDATVITASLYTLPAAGALDPGSTATIGTDGGSVSSSSSLASSHFAPYECQGAGSFNLSVTGTVTVSGTGSLTFGVSASLYGYVQIAYTYNPV